MSFASIGLSSLLVGRSTGDLVASAIFAVVFSYLGYRISIRYRQARGVTPWRLPPAVWAVICLVLQPFGIIIEVLAELTTRAGASGLPKGPAGLGSARSAPFRDPRRIGMSPADPVDGVRVTGGVGDARGYTGPQNEPDQAGKPHEPAPLFGWYPDVTGRNLLRYWDGRSWTDLVSDGTEHSTDPLDPH